MKKIFVATVLLFATTSHAELTNSCRQDIVKASEHHKSVQKGIAEGSITSETADFLLKGSDDVAQLVALTCGGLKKLELERSFIAQIGALSQERVSKIAEETRLEALALYNSLKTQ